ncbi:MAG: penicillin-binding protein 2 [Coriobacteriales bacterium]|nr:penicillin-binding protein 2 [Coriobacteriales bacterium]
MTERRGKTRVGSAGRQLAAPPSSAPTASASRNRNRSTTRNRERSFQPSAGNRNPQISRGRVSGSNRDWVLLGLFSLIAVVLVSRLVYLQVINADEMSALAQEQRTSEVSLTARRGTIYDRNGLPLAMSVDATTIYANPAEIEDPNATAKILAEILGGQPTTYYELITNPSSPTFVYIMQKADPELAERLQQRNTELNQQIAEANADIVSIGDLPPSALAGIHYLEETRRVYPYGQIGAQIIGAVDSEGNGVSGIELMYNSALKGRDGYISTERGKDGTPVPGGVSEQVDPVDGEDIIISIDIDFQQYVESELAKMGADRNCNNANVIVLDGASGEIYAAASLPLYNNSNITQEDVDAGAMQLKPITYAFEPGSIFKTVTASVALEEGILGVDDELFVPANLYFYEGTDYATVVHDAVERGDEYMTFRDIMTHSSNVGVSLIEQQIGNTRYASYLEKYGFGQPTHVDFPNETFGQLADVETWNDVASANISFGQGISVSSLQIASFYGTIANNGVRAQPHFLISRPQANEQPVYKSQRLLSEQTVEQVTSMLQSVVTDGTGQRAQIEGYTVAGKTGTAEKASSEGGYLAGQYIVSFVGFLSGSDSQLVCLTSMDNPIGAEGDVPTMPLFASIMKFAADRYMIAPPTVAAVPEAGEG